MVLRDCKGGFRQYNFCLQLSHAISRARAAHVMQKIAHNSCHSLLPIQCSSEISEHRIRVPYASNRRMRMLLYAYAYVVIRVCPAFVIHCYTFALCGIVLHNKRNGKVKATARGTKFEQ